MSDLALTTPCAGVRTITLNRPAVLNALTHDLVAELHAVLDEVGRERAVRVVILTGAGRGFCSGFDLRTPSLPPGATDLGAPDDGMRGQEHIASLVLRMRELPQPIVCAVNGPAAGGGLALALASDIRLAVPEASFSAAFIRVGLSGCDIGVSWLLPRIVGATHAFELMLTGRTIDAAEALRIGMLGRVVEREELLATATAVAEEIAQHSPFGVRMTKQVMWSNLEIGNLRSAIDLENRTQILATFTGGLDDAAAQFGGSYSNRPHVEQQ